MGEQGQWDVLSVIVLLALGEETGISAQFVYEVEVAKASKALSDILVTIAVWRSVATEAMVFFKCKRSAL